jgi:hypothetical protein
MAIDHKVHFRSYETLLWQAMRVRERMHIDHATQFNFREIVEQYIDDGRISISFNEEEDEPYFNRTNLTINCNRGLWEEAGMREPLASFKLLHELAHALFHRHPLSSFSSSTSSQLTYAGNEESAEWQANLFAALVMAPPYLAIGCNDRRTFAERFNFPSEFIEFWFAQQKVRPLRYSPQFCSKCGSQTVAIIASSLRCVTCGNIS